MTKDGEEDAQRTSSAKDIRKNIHPIEYPFRHPRVLNILKNRTQNQRPEKHCSFQFPPRLQPALLCKSDNPSQSTACKCNCVKHFVHDFQGPLRAEIQIRSREQVNANKHDRCCSRGNPHPETCILKTTRGHVRAW